MTTMQRSKIVPAEKNLSGVVEKWALPDWSHTARDREQLFTTSARGAATTSADHSQNEDSGRQVEQQRGSMGDGYSAGYAEGLQTAQQQLASQTQEVAALLHALENPVRCVTEDVVSELLMLAREIAGAILQKELQTDPAQLLNLIDEAVSKMPMAAVSCRVAINPQDLELLKGLMANDPESEVVTKITWIEDQAVEPGNFIVTQGDSRLHAGIASMLKQVISQPATAAADH